MTFPSLHRAVISNLYQRGTESTYRPPQRFLRTDCLTNAQ